MSNPLSQENLSTDHSSSENARVDSDKLTHSVYLTANVKSWWVHEVMHPIESFFVRHQVHPNTITWMGVVFTGLASLLLAFDFLLLGGWFLFFAASFDFLDGRVARITGKVSASGSFLDSVLDRYTDAFLLGAMIWLFRDSWMLMIVVLAFFGTMATPYVRAKAESLGLKASGGEMQRPERVLYIGAGAVLSGYFEYISYPFQPENWTCPPYFLMAAIAFIAVVSNKVAIERSRACIAQLEKKN